MADEFEERKEGRLCDIVAMEGMYSQKEGNVEREVKRFLVRCVPPTRTMVRYASTLEGAAGCGAPRCWNGRPGRSASGDVGRRR